MASGPENGRPRAAAIAGLLSLIGVLASGPAGAAPSPPERRAAAGIPPGSALAAELGATVDRLRAGEPLEGRHLAFLRVHERLSAGSDFAVEFMEPTLVADVDAPAAPILDGPAGRVVTGGLFVGAAPLVLPGEVGMDSGTVRFSGTGLRGEVTGVPDLWLDRVFALWIRETGPGRYAAEVVPWGPEAMQITGVQPAALATRTRVPSLAAVAHLLRIGLDPAPRFGDEYTIAPVAIRRLEAQLADGSVDRRPDVLTLARLYAAFDRPEAALDLYLRARTDLPADPRLDLEGAQSAWFAGRWQDAWTLLEAGLASGDALATHLCRGLAPHVAEARRRCPPPETPAARDAGPSFVPVRTLLHRDREYLDGFADGLLADLRVTAEEDGATTVDVDVRLTVEGMWADVVLLYAPPLAGWRALPMTRRTDGLRTARLGVDPDDVRPTRLFLRVVHPRTRRVLAQYLDPFEAERVDVPTHPDL